MKNKGMIAAICLILVLGIVTTAATRRYIRGQTGNETSLAGEAEAGAMYEAEPFAAVGNSGNSLTEEMLRANGEVSGTEQAADPEEDEETSTETEDSPDDMDAAADTQKKTLVKAEADMDQTGTEKDGDRVQAEGEAALQSSGSTRREKRSDEWTASQKAEKQAAGSTAPYSANGGAAASPVENGIVSPAGGVSSGAGTGSDRTVQDYRDRLSEIENTVQNLENSGSANTTDAMREAASYEYRLWDAELNQIYQAIMAVLPDEEADTLRGRERRWIRKRDTAAKQASERYKGGTMESVEYTASLADSTRDRAYELLDLYESYLPAE